MTRDQIELLCRNIQASTGDWNPEESILLRHDAAQRLEIEQQAQQIATLREALQLLYDVQNGCPLPKYQKDWDRAMELTQQALKEVKE